MIETHTGLPNTCHDCGEPQTEIWFAISVDAALAGGGICAPCLAKRVGGVEVVVRDSLEFTSPALVTMLKGEATGQPPVAAETVPPIIHDDPAAPQNDLGAESKPSKKSVKRGK